MEARTKKRTETTVALVSAVVLTSFVVGGVYLETHHHTPARERRGEHDPGNANSKDGLFDKLQHLPLLRGYHDFLNGIGEPPNNATLEHLAPQHPAAAEVALGGVAQGNLVTINYTT